MVTTILIGGKSRLYQYRFRDDDSHFGSEYLTDKEAANYNFDNKICYCVPIDEDEESRLANPDYFRGLGTMEFEQHQHQNQNGSINEENDHYVKARKLLEIQQKVAEQLEKLSNCDYDRDLVAARENTLSSIRHLNHYLD